MVQKVNRVRNIKGDGTHSIIKVLFWGELKIIIIKYQVIGRIKLKAIRWMWTLI